jgi:fatty acid desaturase
MHDDRPSLARRALAAVVLAVVAIVAFRLVIGVLSALFWFLAIAVLIVAALWAVSTLKSARRRRGEDRPRRARPGSIREVPAAAPEDRVEAQMRQIQEQLREQGRL